MDGHATTRAGYLIDASLVVLGSEEETASVESVPSDMCVGVDHDGFAGDLDGDIELLSLQAVGDTEGGGEVVLVEGRNAVAEVLYRIPRKISGPVGKVAVYDYLLDLRGDGESTVMSMHWGSYWKMEDVRQTQPEPELTTR